MANPFLATTTVAAEGSGRYRGHIGSDWNLRPLPQGGIVTSVALRAMEVELDDPAQRLRTLHTAYAAQVSDGDVSVEVEVLRRGRSMSQLRAELTDVGRPRGHLTTAIFGRSRPGFSFTGLRPPPDVPPPAVCPSFREPPPPGTEKLEPAPFWESMVEGRRVRAHPRWETHPPGPPEQVTWCRFDEPPWRDDGTLDPLSLTVLVDTMPGAVGERLGSERRDWFAPSVDLTVHLLDDCRSPWLLAHNRAQHAGDGYASADMALWDCGPEGSGAPRLVAYATQIFLFSFSAGAV